MSIQDLTITFPPSRGGHIIDQNRLVATDER